MIEEVTALPEVEKPKSKYAFIETERGCLIQREGGLELEVYYADTYLRIGSAFHAIYGFEKHIESIAIWFADKLVKRQSGMDDAVDMITRALSKRYFQQWQRIVKTVIPPEVEEPARLMWSSTLGDAQVLHEAALYTDEYQYVRRDLEKYHACRLLARSLESTHTRLSILEILRHWRDELAPAVANKHLNKTLDKLPPAVSFTQIRRLSLMHLEAPITNRLHLIFALCGADHHNWGLHERIVLSADETQVKAAAAVFHETLGNRSKTRDIGYVARQILDYPQHYGGNLVGLAERSHEWHEEIRDDEYDDGLPEDYVFPQPESVDLGMLEGYGITLLKTAGDCYQEGRRMSHCVGSYASLAASGRCYLFHVEHGGQQATVEVAPVGYVVQACGPHNRKNVACDYGIRVLEEAFGYERELRP